MDLRERLSSEIGKIRIFDTHEHTMPEAERNTYAVDFTYLFAHYNASDLVAAGMPPRLLEAVRLPFHRYRADYDRRYRTGRSLPEPSDESLSLEERWSAMEPYWEAMRTTAYGRWTLIMIRDLFGVDDLSRGTFEALSEAISASRKPGWFKHVLKEKAGIERSIIDLRTTDVDAEFFSPVMRMDPYVAVRSRADLDVLEQDTGEAIHSLADLEHALRDALARHKEAGAVGVKNGMAYQRTLRYDRVPRHEAEVIFSRIFDHLGEGLSWAEAKPLQDHLFHCVIRAAIDLDLPIQIHTGLQEGNGNIIANSRPSLLANLLMEYREARFDLFHGGYPYFREWTSLAKNFANVYPDLCWIFIISPSFSKQLLHELIEMVPGNKILGFGGDSIPVEGAYAHACMARDVFTDVLAEKVESGWLTEEEALGLAGLCLRDNAAALYA